MIVFNGGKIKDVPQIKAKIIEVWVNGYKVWPEPKPEPDLPDELKKKVRSCFALGKWYNVFYWTDDYAWANDIYQALEYFNELYGTNYELQLDEEE